MKQSQGTPSMEGHDELQGRASSGFQKQISQTKQC